MSLGAVLLPVTGHPADEVAFDIALSVSGVCEAELTAVCIRPDPIDIVRYVADWSSPPLTGETLAALEEQGRAEAQNASRVFDDWRRRRGLPLMEEGAGGGVSISWRERVGAPGTVLRDMARFADLVVMRGLGAEGPVDGAAMLEAVLFDAGRPALLAPPVMPADLFGVALVAWAGGREDARAVTAALPLLSRMRRVEIRTVGDVDANADQLVAYLKSHGVAAAAAVLRPGAGSVAVTLLAEAGSLSASLLVMGGYHHSPAREALFGGATREVVAHVSLPVLLAH